MSALDRVVLQYPDGEEHRLRIAYTINEMLTGRCNNVGSFTLDASVATTTVTDNLFAIDQIVIWTPTTANAAAEYAAGGMYLSDRSNGSFEITHANNAQTDRTFVYARIG